MAFLEQLRSKPNLRKIEQVNDRSNPNLTVSNNEAEVAAYQQTVLDVNIEAWVELLGELTFPTHFLPLSHGDMAVLIDAYECNIKNPPVEFSAEMKTALADLEARLDSVISQVSHGSAHGVFVKTSSRSAKDATIFHSELETRYRNYVQESQANDGNGKLICLLKAAHGLFQIHSAREALQQFVHSERIYQDMCLARDAKYEQESIVVRGWVPIDVDMEFRGFVANGRLNALSQYNHVAYFPRVVDLKEELAQKITVFFAEKVVPRLSKFNKYVVDFAVVGPNLDQIYVIELNPFLPSTDSALFSWREESALLENGPFDFRIRTEPMAQPHLVVGTAWRQLLLS
eukprot:TRINITY_DN14358_c0_g1_i3.p1 TRINITY_DN14358_c0_g1~~TRINITY_DN14358_c0_g1_i3.p1  ORF type:complete len:344 (-),score=101.32 TRINITY_DN14358_c0_g1_i3:104-1135(-)